MEDLLHKFENKQPEIVFEWHDSETSARGWLVINSLRGGAAGGGTRMRIGLDKREVESLAKVMEIKFSIAGPSIGGAKSGIDFDPKDPRKLQVLERWYKAIAPLLKNYYGTGGDMNIDEVHEVIPLCKKNGVMHPQEGVLTGHFLPTNEQKQNRIKQLNDGVLKIVKDEEFTPDISKSYTVSDLITGYGVSESVKHYYNIYGGTISNKNVIVQGWGNVASSAAYFLSKQGAKIVGIIDKIGGLINKNGFTYEEIKELYLSKKGNELYHQNLLSFDEINSLIWNLKTDVFIPCAASRIVNKNQIENLISSGLELIACGANVPFADKEIFFGPIADFADKNISIIPDFIANCGMARVFAFLMSNDLNEISDADIFNDVSSTIKNAIKKVYENYKSKTGIAKKALENALKTLT